ncbi:hypothetical protein [Cognatishimia maritima]|uniref:hypothetical protein n=1 Tax=Cognatishimia maritima TaxID=870908 RepID=UPI00104269D2|nr:hypothetical protein [Cognatishimia maritima]
MSAMTRDGLQYYRNVTGSLEAKAKSKGGRLPLYEHMRLSYCKKPFLYFDTDEEITQLAYDAANNIQYLGEEGKIEARPVDNDYWFRVWQTFQETMEEMARRGIHPREIIGDRDKFAQYFHDGEPVGLRLLKGVSFAPFKKLLKFSRRDYVQDMLNIGRFRISPASSYNNPAYNVAMADVEVERRYRVSLISEYMDGEDFIEVKGNRIPVSQGYLPVDFPLPDYYLFSTCGLPERRMPTDFQSNAALLIHRPREFVRRIKVALQNAQPTWQFMEGPVKYYDRYKDIPSDQDQEFYKEFKFAYQAEHRIILRPNGIGHYTNLQPFFVEIGNLSDIAEMLHT